MNIPEEKRTEEGSVEYAVLVDLGSGHLSSMEIRLGDVDRYHSNIRGKEGIDRPEKLVLGEI